MITYNTKINRARFNEIEQALESAMKHGSIQLAYQPRVDMRSNETVSFEVLARWDHPTLGKISPEEFVRIAEESGHIYELGFYIISMAFQQLKKWQKLFGDGLIPMLSINLSPFQLQQVGFVERLKKLVRRHQIQLSNVEFELTESNFHGEFSDLKQTLNIICDMGVKLSIDDFGKACSTLYRLKELPVYLIKLDRLFIRDLAVNEHDAAILIAILSFAQTLNLLVVAEGVETQQQVDFLLAYGCTLAQGYYFSEPVPANVVDSLICQQANGQPHRASVTHL